MPFVRYRGDPDPVDEDIDAVRADIAAGRYTKEDVWAYNSGQPDATGRRRQICIEGSSVRILGPDEGLSRFYQWGCEIGSYTIHVTDADWKRIQALPEANTFVLAVER